jgi:hypothetical protein
MLSMLFDVPLNDMVMVVLSCFGANRVPDKLDRGKYI